MFYYHDTGELSKPSEAQRKAVTKIRKVTYINDSPNPRVAEPVFSYGTEIVEERAVSANYFNSPDVVRPDKTIDNRNPDRVIERD